MAEDLGLITPEVDALRLELTMPGMRVLQFGFSDKGAHMHLPHQYVPGTVAYTGTHDNDTTQGWWETAGKQSARLWRRWSVRVQPSADVAVDSRGCGQRGTDRDLPGAGSAGIRLGGADEYSGGASGNWSWRVPEGSWTKELAARWPRSSK